MGKKITPYDEILVTLLKLKREHPTYTLGQHLSTALGDYGDIWGVSDKEIAFALEKYKTELECNTVSDEEVDKIVKDAQDLGKLFQEEEDYE